jgi:hypothetical protein
MMEDLGFFEDLSTVQVTDKLFLLSVGGVVGPGSLMSLIVSKFRKQLK